MSSKIIHQCDYCGTEEQCRELPETWMIERLEDSKHYFHHRMWCSSCVRAIFNKNLRRAE